ncbi:MAG: N-6 DNA methylase [Propionivibrio sp.]|uniref:N-6 DNA methylase n=1 Tax=Propionivibrio sp. TaxID=2212460 RepID=UPI001B75BB0D|nr:N-6 DNA methylase [Propionivibrio sp.]MBP7203801.1 N-6 DNA methylase [Propionivibrio sp.]
MLDAETKRRIDACRDILVGKVPDPKSQVEQITIALIYKFMDDMDREAEDLGGARRFFAGDFARYGWGELKAPELSGKEKLDRYAEAIGRMNENPGIPALFRDIFKNAYLPYRDPETLRAFLKEIDGFTYDHSERLGDAFEYLLSVLGSQGDAGQFRTPRHIIDFMVELIDPKKHESLLDPACGTAGFLISAWKHVLRQNTTPRPQGEGPGVRVGNQLTPAERATLAANIRGYDISPDMVRLSLVNLYLHGFTDPHIVEYDTLTSEERWNETADVILANPPFMSPKGGIKPHKRFSVQATRSEVLFVDYIAEHLSPTGRAAIVVPEGIIFQSGTAYKNLREMLVKTALIAVVSLPAGVFNPYSGVKTSILILDKRRAKTCDSVLFVKVQNDGYNLGAQRRAVDGSDLPEARRLLAAFLTAPEKFENGPMAHAVKRTKIGENGEWNLSGERYTFDAAIETHFPMVALGDPAVFHMESGGTPKSTEETYWNGGIHWATLVDLPQTDFITQITRTERTISEAGLSNSSAKVLPIGTVVVSSRATIGRVGIARIPLATNQGFKNIIIRDGTRALPEFIAYMMKRLAPRMESLATGGTFKEISKSTIASLEIPLPPLAIQQEIVAEIGGYQKIIDGARQVVENYRPHIDVQPDWPVVELGVLCDVKSGGTPDRSNAAYWNGNIPWVKTGQIDFGRITAAEEFITDVGMENSSARMIPAGTILMAMYGQGITRGKVAILEIDATINQACAAILPKEINSYDRDYLFYALSAKYGELRSVSESRGGNQSNLNSQLIRATKISLPPLETQRAIVAEIEAEQVLVEANRQLIARFEAKIKALIDRVWGGGDTV